MTTTGAAVVAAQELGQVLDLTAITLQRRAGSRTPLQLQGGAAARNLFRVC